ncbi:hypothetical protein RAS2_20100 [Phycisphaerae bacterium RAS2]|nr:hypothetical protein RAS2_20100 [Phycisphaerae bacterium RAS2]
MSTVDLANIRTTEFGVCLYGDGNDNNVLVPVDAGVQTALREMAQATADKIGCFGRNANLPSYEPAEKYAATEALKCPIDDDLEASAPVALFRANNLPTSVAAIAEPSAIEFYFARLRDNRGRQLIAVKRAAQFKGMLKAKGRLIRWLDDTMQVVEDDVFKLDPDFDYLVTDDEIYILRPSAFEFTVDLDETILAKAKENAESLHNTVAFIDFSGIAEYVGGHKRAARLVAALKKRNDLASTDQRLLKKECRETGVAVERRNGRMCPAAGHEYEFLMLLDRRRYALTLIADTPETYEAPSRRRVNGGAA